MLEELGCAAFLKKTKKYCDSMRVETSLDWWPPSLDLWEASWFSLSKSLIRRVVSKIPSAPPTDGEGEEVFLPGKSCESVGGHTDFFRPAVSESPNACLDLAVFLNHFVHEK